MEHSNEEIFVGIDVAKVSYSVVTAYAGRSGEGRPGDRVKTDRSDAIRLARFFRAGELTEV
ncbi:hypothetical protein [Paremcibacter congregatus]|uniref:hypothetical protein n=1 Tax=Paremcibacter congregatus TaxID=2043170 RepID=UPI0030EDD423|tara:strand:+ start:1751 stop:1933 length:183 start_codon:yes stop_codon:yes gene_type:complete